MRQVSWKKKNRALREVMGTALVARVGWGSQKACFHSIIKLEMEGRV